MAGNDWRDFDLIICDEAHRTTGVTLTGEDESYFTRVHNNDYLRADKRLYMTATPKIFNPKVKDAAKEKDAVLTSMDDAALFGPVFHRLGFGTAVSLGLLTDYKVVVLAIPEDQVTPIYQQGAIYGELPLPETAKLVGCWNALAKRKSGFTDVQYGSDTTPMHRAVAFAKDIKTSKQIASEFPELVNKHLRNLMNSEVSDDLGVQCRHVDGTMNAIERGEALDWLKTDVESEHPVCRILTNARCLSEGVDVPTLDAVLFLNPRRSQVDVIQAVGRVMRKAEGKEFGYIILPVAVPAGTTPEDSLSDNQRYAVVWQVLQAIRAHDEDFEAKLNASQYNGTLPENIIVDYVDLKPTAPADPFSGSAGGDDTEVIDGGSGSGPGGESDSRQMQLELFLQASEWKDAVYSKIVKKVGDRLYWDDWSKDIGDIASRYINLIEQLLEDPINQDYFTSFVTALQKTLNPAVDGAQAVEMLAQHLITKPLFDAMFPSQEFTSQNPVSQAMQKILDRLATNKVFETEREPLAKFYEAMTQKIRAITTLDGKQEIMRTLYDKFFARAFPSMQDRLGIVFTPVPVVDYILRSADVALRRHLGKSLGDEGISIIEPFLGTGTFITRLLQSGLIKPDQLERKYLREIFANEIVLLSYYIASINIEEVYRQIRIEQGVGDEYVEFPGLSLTDTFQIHEEENRFDEVGDFAANMERVERQKEAKIRVVVMNPPYSAGQKSANDNNQNLKYAFLDKQIESSYAARSTGTNKNSLYDSYYRALRWATDRIGPEGVIAFVSNSSFIDGNTADGVRLSLAEEFSDIYVYNLRGGIRGKMGEAAAREGGNVFDIMTGVAVTVLVKTSDRVGPCKIHYAEIADYLARQEKLDILISQESIAGTDFEVITPNNHGDWVNQRDEKYLTYQSIGDKKTKGKSDTPATFIQYSRGLETSRDSWCYNFSKTSVAENMQRMITNYNKQIDAGKTSKTANMDDSYVAWTRKLKRELDRRIEHTFDAFYIRAGVYRPFCTQSVYFNSAMNEYVNQLPQIFPTPQQPNLGISIPAGPSAEYFMPIMYEMLPALTPNGGNQFFPLYTWEHVTDNDPQGSLLEMLESAGTPEEFSGTFDFSRSISEQVSRRSGDYRRRDNITDGTLNAYREHYKDAQIEKEDIFFYVYALLHHEDYRERYAADLKKMLPRIPKVTDFWSYSNIGRELADLHVNYEHLDAYPSIQEVEGMSPTIDDWTKYRVTKLAWGKGPGGSKDMTCLIYNDYLKITGIPEEANTYKIGGRSPLEWMIDRYQVTTDKKTGIVNDPNDYCREIGDPAYIAKLVGKLVTVSMRTISLTRSLPEFIIEEEAQ
ncbi:type ISP restriction/modification enzyme [Actinotignum sanguinis]|uniref:type ISP restriction/modification enzyme n=1 Tax=Actinotignum sanguinis TaxID=1445614 RepID=UPI0023EA5C00|nr:type ISP restriction/modification enzyme [Actinotignum sanguinis]MDY5148448.1 type ISP restriction/modification enzyme [Actinotignum sanguinis]